MGLIYADIILSNVRKPDIQRIKVSALVDTGAVHLCIPEHIALQLDLDIYEEREVETADGSPSKRPYVGPILAQFANRHCLTGAMVLGNEVLLGGNPYGRYGFGHQPQPTDGCGEPGQSQFCG